MTTLERRYRRMLYTYPYDYRAERGDEILGTLLDGARAGQTRPTLRERRALLFGGLKVRSAQNRRLPTRTNLRLAMAFGAAMTLALLVTSGVSENIEQTGPLVTRTWYSCDWLTALTSLLVIVSVALAWSRRRLLGVIVALVTAGVAISADHADGVAIAGDIVVLTVLAYGREPMPTPWLWSVGIVALVSLMASLPMAVFSTGFVWLFPAVYLGLVLWAVLDARPAFGALSQLLLVMVIDALRQSVLPGNPGVPISHFLTFIGAAAVLAIPLAFRMRRQAVL